MKSNSTLGKIFGYMGIAVISIGVMLFLGKHSLNFFINTFQAEDALFAYLGLLLTSGGAVIWMGIFVWNANTHLRRAIALIMMVVALAGEMVTAVFDMQNAALYASGFQFLPEELKQMTDLIGYLGAFTGLMLIIYSIGDLIFAAFKDDDGDGTINLLDPVDNRTGEPTKGIVWPWSKKQKGQPNLKPVQTNNVELDEGSLAWLERMEELIRSRGVPAPENKNGQHTADPTNQPRQ